MKRFITASLIVCSLIALFALPARAQSVGTVKSKSVAVHAEPSPKSEILLELQSGKSVNVIGKKGTWLHIKVALDASFTFDGWVPANAIAIGASTKPAVKKPVPTAIPTPMPKKLPLLIPTPVPQSPAGLDQFFESVPGSGSSAPTPQSSAPLAPASSPEAQAEPDVKRERRVPKGDGLFAQLTDKASASLGLGYLLYHYKLKNGGTTPSELFSYNIPGLGVDLDLRYWFMERNEGKIRIGSSLQYQFGLYQNDTNLLDNNGVLFQTRQTQSTSHDILLKFLSEYRFTPTADGAAVGGGLGFEYFRFSADDISDDTAPINVYVSQTTMTLLASLYGRMPIPKLRNFMAEAGVDVLAFSFVSESPSDITGTDPKGKLGFAPTLTVSWLPTDQHQVSAGYKLRLQDFDFSGSGSRAGGTANVTDGSVENAVHYVFLKYSYLF